jgi:hypothetical protein
VATLQTAVPAQTVTNLGGHGLLAIIALAALAVAR